MKKSTKIILLLSAALISLGLLLTIGSLASGVQIERILENELWDAVLYERTAENDFSPDGRYTVSPAGIQELSISWTDGTILIEPYDGTEILIEESSAGGIDEKHHLGFTTTNGVLQIFDNPTLAAIHFSLNRPIPRRDLCVHLPSALAQDLGSLDLDAADGEMDLRDLHVKTLTIDTVDGDIRVQNSVIETLEVDAANANLWLQNAQLQTLETDHLDGDITVLTSDINDLDISTMDGNFSGDFLHCPQTIHFDSLSGSMELHLPSDSQFTATWDSLSGDYHSDFQGSYGARTHTVGDGSAEISMSTMDGSLHILTTDSPA